MTKRYRPVSLGSTRGKGRIISEAKGPMRGGRSNQYWNPPKHAAPVKTINDTAELKKIQDEVNSGASKKKSAYERLKVKIRSTPGAGGAFKIGMSGGGGGAGRK